MDIKDLKRWIEACTGETTEVGEGLRHLLQFYENNHDASAAFNRGQGVEYKGTGDGEYKFSGTIQGCVVSSNGDRYYGVENEDRLILFYPASLLRRVGP